MKNSIIESIKSLPPLSKTIIDINRVFADENSGIGDLADVIQSDPMIVANLLKEANSAFYSFSQEIRNVHQAVSLFGMSTTRSIALGNSVRKLLNVDMQPYGITSEKFAQISHMQATLVNKWYAKIDKEKAEKLYLAALLQETGKILISSDVIQQDEDISFQSEIALSTNIAEVEKAYVDVTTAEITAEVFAHWEFSKDFIEMIRYADNPLTAPQELQEFSMALHIVKMIIPVNLPLSEQAINFGLSFALKAGFDTRILQNAIDEILEIQKVLND